MTEEEQSAVDVVTEIIMTIMLAGAMIFGFGILAGYAIWGKG